MVEAEDNQVVTSMSSCFISCCSVVHRRHSDITLLSLLFFWLDLALYVSLFLNWKASFRCLAGEGRSTCRESY